MNNYQSMLELINLKYGALSKNRYGTSTHHRVDGVRSNASHYQRLKNKVNYGYNFDLLLNDGSRYRGE